MARFVFNPRERVSPRHFPTVAGAFFCLGLGGCVGSVQLSCFEDIEADRLICSGNLGLPRPEGRPAPEPAPQAVND